MTSLLVTNRKPHFVYITEPWKSWETRKRNCKKAWSTSLKTRGDCINIPILASRDDFLGNSEVKAAGSQFKTWNVSNMVLSGFNDLILLDSHEEKIGRRTEIVISNDKEDNIDRYMHKPSFHKCKGSLKKTWKIIHTTVLQYTKLLETLQESAP